MYLHNGEAIWSCANHTKSEWIDLCHSIETHSLSISLFSHSNLDKYKMESIHNVFLLSGYGGFIHTVPEYLHILM